MVKCPICGEDVSYAEYVKHYESHQETGGLRPTVARDGKRVGGLVTPEAESFRRETSKMDRWVYQGDIADYFKSPHRPKTVGVDSVAEWLIPFVPPDRWMYVWDLVDYGDLVKVMFERLCKALDAPPLVLEIVYRQRWKPSMDGYAGVPGKVILTINTSRTEEILPGDIAYLLIHEILHQKYPEWEEERVNAEGVRFYETLFGEKLSGWEFTY